jgi:hypothetical protein
LAKKLVLEAKERERLKKVMCSFCPIITKEKEEEKQKAGQAQPRILGFLKTIQKTPIAPGSKRTTFSSLIIV